jgi:hypothetical protein
VWRKAAPPPGPVRHTFGPNRRGESGGLSYRPNRQAGVPDDPAKIFGCGCRGLRRHLFDRRRPVTLGPNGGCTGLACARFRARLKSFTVLEVGNGREGWRFMAARVKSTINPARCSCYPLGRPDSFRRASGIDHSFGRRAPSWRLLARQFEATLSCSRVPRLKPNCSHFWL